jgi:hypothetical protein
MKKSNWILLGIAVLLIVLGLVYSIPVREGAAGNCKNPDCSKKENEHCSDCKTGKTKTLKPAEKSKSPDAKKKK